MIRPYDTLCLKLCRYVSSMLAFAEFRDTKWWRETMDKLQEGGGGGGEGGGKESFPVAGGGGGGGASRLKGNLPGPSASAAAAAVPCSTESAEPHIQAAGAGQPPSSGVAASVLWPAGGASGGWTGGRAGDFTCLRGMSQLWLQIPMFTPAPFRLACIGVFSVRRCYLCCSDGLTLCSWA